MIQKGSIIYLIMLIISISIMGIIIYPLFDLIYCRYITNSKFIYSVSNYITKPVLFGIVLGTTLWIVDKRNKKN